MNVQHIQVEINQCKAEQDNQKQIKRVNENSIIIKKSIEIYINVVFESKSFQLYIIWIQLDLHHHLQELRVTDKTLFSMTHIVRSISFSC